MNIRTGDGFMDIRVGNRIVVRGQQLIVEQFIFEQVDQRLDLNRVWASDKAGGGWHDVLVSDITDIEQQVA